MKMFKKVLVLVCAIALVFQFTVSLVSAEGTTPVIDNGGDGIFLSDLEWKSWYMFESSSEDETPKYKPSKDMQENEMLITIGGIEYQKGLRYHPDWKKEGKENGYADIVYDISGQNRTRFFAVVGKDSVGSSAHNIQFQVLCDDKVAYETPVLGPKDSHAIDIDVTGCKLLTLRALDGGDDIHDDSCAWGNAQIYTNQLSVPKTEVQQLEDGIYLSDIEWTSWSMYESSSADATPKYKPSIDTEEQGGPIVIGGVMYPKGLRYHPDVPKDGNQGFSDITYDISKQHYMMFSAVVGKDSVGSKANNIQFQVLADDKVVYETPVLGPKDAHKIECEIAGAKTLTLRALDSGDGINDDSCAWGNPQLYLIDAAAALDDQLAEEAKNESSNETTVESTTPAGTPDDSSKPADKDAGSSTTIIVVSIVIILAAIIVIVVVANKKKKAK